MELDWFCTGVLNVRHLCLMRAFMNYSACWRSKKALVSIRCLTINTQANRVAIVCSIITWIFNLIQVLGGHISTLSNKDTCDFCVWIMLVANYYCLIYCSSFVRLSCSALFNEIILFDLILLFSFHVHPVNIQFWSWIVLQVFWSH